MLRLMHAKCQPGSGFTLIELSIVLVIIGLIVGGILTGRDLIDAAAQRAQITQIERYNTAVRTFQTKYGYLPGDIPDPQASQFGFVARGAYQGEGDGNGVIEGDCENTANPPEIRGMDLTCGELAVFWQDLVTAKLVDNVHIKYALSTTVPNWAQLNSDPSIGDVMPTAKLGNNSIFVYVYSFGGINYFAVSTVTQWSWYLYAAANPGFTVQQAYNIDKKMDDGLPQSGSVTACYINESIGVERGVSAAGNGAEGANGGNGVAALCVPTTTATPPLSTDCYGNNNTAGTMTYSVKTNATLQNCALSFRFQ